MNRLDPESDTTSAQGSAPAPANRRRFSFASLRRALLRWDHLLAVLILGFPFLLLNVLGVLWLFQHDAVLWFLAATLLISLTMVALQKYLRQRWRTQAEAAVSSAEMSVAPDPDWLPLEKAVFAEVSQHIAELTRSPLQWEQLPEHALTVVNKVASGLRGKKSDDAADFALQFTLPEALLLLESTAARYRDHLRNKVPFSDQVSLATLHWLWRQRDRANLIWQIAHGGSRVARFALNPAAGVLHELQKLAASGTADYLTDTMAGMMQAMLLEEVAFGAIELYSGRLRFSDHELMRIELATTGQDNARLALPDEPLRVLFVGQISAGKSTLINALLAEELAETDAAATTAGLITYRTAIEGVACHFLDSEGLDGSPQNQQRMLEEMSNADLLVWVVRGNRPARDVDIRLRQQFDDWFQCRPRHRKPELLVVASAMDVLAGAHATDAKFAHEIVVAASAAIAADMAVAQVLPFAGADSRYLASIKAALRDALPEAKRVQRNRRRLQGAAHERSLRGHLRRGGRGVSKGIKMVGKRAAGMIKRGKESGTGPR